MENFRRLVNAVSSSLPADKHSFSAITFYYFFFILKSNYFLQKKKKKINSDIQFFWNYSSSYDPHIEKQNFFSLLNRNIYFQSTAQLCQNHIDFNIRTSEYSFIKDIQLYISLNINFLFSLFSYEKWGNDSIINLHSI